MPIFGKILEQPFFFSSVFPSRMEDFDKFLFLRLHPRAKRTQILHRYSSHDINSEHIWVIPRK